MYEYVGCGDNSSSGGNKVDLKYFEVEKWKGTVPGKIKQTHYQKIFTVFRLFPNLSLQNNVLFIQNALRFCAMLKRAYFARR